MEKKYSKNVKRDIFDKISKMPRYNKILELVVDELKKGNSPVVIENWTTKFRRLKGENLFWSDIRKCRINVDEIMEILDANDKASVSTRSYLDIGNAEQSHFLPVIVIIVAEHKQVLLQDSCVPSVEITDTLTYFGHRDKNYISLLLKEMGYIVEEGSEANKNGLLITLGE